MQYYYTDQLNQVLGPVSDEELNGLYRVGTITPETNVFPEGAADWLPYHAISVLPPPPPPRSLAPALYTPPTTLSATPMHPVAAATRTCPFCAEDVLINARKCKHCGETIDVALRAAEEAKRSNATPMVFMNAGGGAAVAAPAPRPTVVVVGGQKSGLVAALLNVLIPGLGYMYCGRVLIGVLAFFMTVFVVVLTAGVGGLIIYPILIIDGFLAAGRANRKVLVVAG